ncbi:5'-nucleotidase domain-containing protein [Vitis vinifera]|uniref:5'-nucleotidase domain-containing protein n=1 Tax=Vitis vinifera TaxID=29760 RepID=A0A438HV68_VITVI|nr:5'-nucleotidase domain-containing protein [Vitis vinifera]
MKHEYNPYKDQACLIADMVQYFVDAKLEFDPSYIYQDVNHAIQHAHQSGLVHRGILSDPDRYLVKNGQLLRFLKMLREKGKNLFLLTNSPFNFVDGGMRFMLEDSLGERESWRELFDVVIAKANKPNFYSSEHPFRFVMYFGDHLFSDLRGPSKAGWRTAAIIQELEVCILSLYFQPFSFSEIQIQNEDSYRFEQAWELGSVGFLA